MKISIRFVLCGFHLSVFIQTIEHTTTFKLHTNERKIRIELKSNEFEMKAKQCMKKKKYSLWKNIHYENVQFACFFSFVFFALERKYAFVSFAPVKSVRGERENEMHFDFVAESHTTSKCLYTLAPNRLRLYALHYCHRKPQTWCELCAHLQIYRINRIFAVS